MPQQFSIKSIVILTAIAAIAIVLLRPVFVAAQTVGLYLSLAYSIGFVSPILAFVSLLAIPSISLLQIGEITKEEASKDRVFLLCPLPTFGLVFFLCLHFDLDLGHLVGIVGTVATILCSLVCLIVAAIQNDRHRVVFAAMSLLGSILAWHLSSTIILVIYSSL